MIPIFGRVAVGHQKLTLSCCLLFFFSALTELPLEALTSSLHFILFLFFFE